MRRTSRRQVFLGWAVALAAPMIGCGGSDLHDDATLHVSPRVVTAGTPIVASVTAPASAPGILMTGDTTLIERAGDSGNAREYFLFSAKGRSSAKPVPVDDSAMAPVALRIPSRQRLRIPERLPAGTYQVAKEVDHPNHGSFRVSATIRVTH